MSSVNKNKSGTCKCIDYYTDDKNYNYVKQVRKKSGAIHEVKCNNKVEGNNHFCENIRNVLSF